VIRATRLFRPSESLWTVVEFKGEPFQTGTVAGQWHRDEIHKIALPAGATYVVDYRIGPSQAAFKDEEVAMLVYMSFNGID
jgi:hypothetical protein